MPLSMRTAACLLGLVVLTNPANAQSQTSDTIEGHLAAGKALAGGRDNTPDFYGLVTAICVAPQRGEAAAGRTRTARKSRSQGDVSGAKESL
jgi:metallo-beta-lactamase class B